VLDTGLTPELLAEGDARELARAIQELRRDVGLELDDRIDLWVSPQPAALAAHLSRVAADTLADIADGDRPADARSATVGLDAGQVEIAVRRRTPVPEPG
jgi:isoleucyl-tRNA synthetase